MSQTRPLSISIVIPVFNEEDHLRDCLEAIAKQKLPPKEVFVIDNNSTDNTAAIAQRFDFVTLLGERRQGQVYAQAVGFNAATSDVVGRIDADTILPPDWTARVLAAFDDAAVVAIAGAPLPYDVWVTKIGEAIFNLYHRWVSQLVSGQVMLWGANCAVRRTAWQKVAPDLHYRADIWEDFDLAFHLEDCGKLKYLSELKAACSFRAAYKSPIQQFKYQIRCIRTFRLHRSLARCVLLAFLWATQLIFLPVGIVNYIWWWSAGRHRTSVHR